MIVNRITSDKKTWLDSMMKEELGLFEERFENPSRVGLTMFLAFVVGGLVPITPFLLISITQTIFLVASTVTLASLFIIGVCKTTFTNNHWFVSGIEIVSVGLLAAAIPYAIGELFLPTILSKMLG